LSQGSAEEPWFASTVRRVTKWSQTGSRRFDGIAESEGAGCPGLAFEHLVPVGDVHIAEVGPSETHIGEPCTMWFWDDRDHAAGLVTNLDSEPGRDVKSSFFVDGHTVGAGVGIAIGDPKMEIFLAMNQGSVGLDMERVNELPAGIRDIEEGLVRGKADPVGIVDSGVDDPFLELVVSEPDLFVAGIGPITDAAGDGEVIAGDLCEEGVGGAVGFVNDDLFLAAGSSEQVAVAVEFEAAHAAGVFGEYCNRTVLGDAMDSIVGDVGEEDFALGIGSDGFGEFVAFTDE